MKITVDIDDELLRQAMELGRSTGRPLRELIEQGLRTVLEPGNARSGYRLPDLSFGSQGSPDPLEKYSWQELRDIIYGCGDPR